jgi:hypothetical protein
MTYSPGFFSRLKEKGALAKDVWGVIGSAYVDYPFPLSCIFSLMGLQTECSGRDDGNFLFAI